MAVKNPKHEPRIPIQRLLEKRTREQILSGELAAGARLPSTQEMAFLWETHPNTVQRALTPLVREGLLTRIPRLGTFVRKMDREISRVGIYYAGDFWLQKTFAFYGALHAELQKLLRKSNIDLMVWVDPRTPQEQQKPWAALIAAAKNREIEALILPIAFHEWLQKVPVPIACFESRLGIPTTVHLNFHQFADLSLQQVLQQGCKSIGIISADPYSSRGNGINPGNEAFYAYFFQRAEELGILLRKQWVLRPKNRPSGEQHAPFGYSQFHALWDQSERPEALVIWPDSVAHGALLAISERNLSIPQDLKLILHKNDDVGLFCPVAASFVVSHVKEVAVALWEQICRQSRGDRCRPIQVRFEIQPAKTPQSKPKPVSRKKAGNTGGLA